MTLISLNLPSTPVPMEGPSFWRKAWGTIFANFWSALWGGPKCFTFKAVKGRIDTEHGPRRSRNCKSWTANPETEEKASKHSRHCCYLPVTKVWKNFMWWWWKHLITSGVYWPVKWPSAENQKRVSLNSWLGVNDAYLLFFLISTKSASAMHVSRKVHLCTCVLWFGF